MARKTKKKTTRGKKNSQNWFMQLVAGEDPEHRIMIAKKVGILMVVFLVFIAAGKGLTMLDGYVHTVTDDRDVSLTVELAEPPSWASQDLVEDICLSSGVRSDDFLLDEELVKTWAVNLKNNPWIKQINRVYKRYDGRVIIDCDLRQPVAKIQQNGIARYLDLEGVVLPGMPVHGHMITITGQSSIMPPVGEPIRNKSVLAGLEVLAYIMKMDSSMERHDRILPELYTLDVSNYGGKIDSNQPHLVFYTKHNTEIRWGAAVKHELPLNEAPLKTKLAKLYKAFRLYGSLDEYNYVELRDWRNEKSDPLRRNDG